MRRSVPVVNNPITINAGHPYPIGGTVAFDRRQTSWKMYRPYENLRGFPNQSSSLPIYSSHVRPRTSSSDPKNRPDQSYLVPQTAQRNFPTINSNVIHCIPSHPSFLFTQTSELHAARSRESQSRAYAAWIFGYLYALPRYRGCPELSHETRYRMVGLFQAVIVGAQLDPWSIFLALWYINQFPVETFEVANVQAFRKTANLENIIFQTFVIGCMLATKWLRDVVITAKSWQWLTTLPVEFLNRLEISMLLKLEFKLNVDRSNWHSWLIELRDYHASPDRARRNDDKAARAVVLQSVGDCIRVVDKPQKAWSSFRTGPLRCLDC